MTMCYLGFRSERRCIILDIVTAYGRQRQWTTGFGFDLLQTAVRVPILKKLSASTISSGSRVEGIRLLLQSGSKPTWHLVQPCCLAKKAIPDKLMQQGFAAVVLDTGLGRPRTSLQQNDGCQTTRVLLTICNMIKTFSDRSQFAGRFKYRPCYVLKEGW